MAETNASGNWSQSNAASPMVLYQRVREGACQRISTALDGTNGKLAAKLVDGFNISADILVMPMNLQASRPALAAHVSCANSAV